MSDDLPIAFSVTWAEFHELLHLGGNTDHDYAAGIRGNLTGTTRILGVERARELLDLLTVYENVALVPKAGSLVSRKPFIPIPFEQSLSRTPPPEDPLPMGPPDLGAPATIPAPPMSPFSPGSRKEP